MTNNGLKALFPASFLFGALGVFGIWLVGAFFLERLSNFLVVTGLLVSSKKPHFITLPFVGTGMSIRTILALLGVMFIVGGISYFLSLIHRHDPDMDEAPPPPARDSISRNDPMMDFGMDPMMGGYGMPPSPPLGGGLGSGLPPMGPQGF